ncbi:nickel pincer cofactor biosynthesis protein LarB [Pararhodobacter sp. SW119]|uniref:nickel pincer cofactor biosynthesis protein LarB n=1 Tax=Pararhodobacter sp. SW119 TaxID=2780075 RepID=UPI001AE09FBC|nr:nickel pincer cofactor biosynthesis protein LarB [Pararhodobacter sp. SW119]
MADPFGAVPHLTFDADRAARIGLEEVVLAESKPLPLLAGLLEAAQREGRRLLCTRLTEAQHAGLPETVRAAMDYCMISRTGWLGAPAAVEGGADVVVVTAGTSDAGPATEAVRVLRWSGVEGELVADVGVAGLWRLLRWAERLQAADVVIVCAGMDAALPSVVAGLVGGVVIAVPTSAGYGVAAGGRTALNAALASCAPGVVVVNIDNGYGAACAALRVTARLRRQHGVPR